MDNFAKICAQMAKILGTDLGFPLSVDGNCGLIIVRSAQQSQLEVLLAAAGKETTYNPEKLGDFDRLLHNTGAFQAMILIGTPADFFVEKMSFHKQIAGRPALFLSNIAHMKPKEVRFHPGGHSFGRDMAAEKILLRNLIAFAEQAGVSCVVTTHHGASTQLCKAMAKLPVSASDHGAVLFDLENAAHRQLANAYLGCALSEIPPKTARASADGNRKNGRGRKPNPHAHH